LVIGYLIFLIYRNRIELIFADILHARAQLKNKKPQHRAHRGTQRYTEVKDEFRKVFQFIPVLSIKQNKKPQHRAHRGTQRYTEVKDEFRKVFQFIPVLSIKQFEWRIRFHSVIIGGQQSLPTLHKK